MSNKKKVAHWKKDKFFLYSSIQTRFFLGGKQRNIKGKLFSWNAKKKKVSACLWGAIELHFLWNKVFSYLADLKNKNKKHQIKSFVSTS